MGQRVLKKLADSQEMHHQVKRGTTSGESNKSKKGESMSRERKQMIS